jgi:hypothetical protein
VKPHAFRLLSGADALTDYRRSPTLRDPFCRYCGVRTFDTGELPALGGAFVGIQIASLDDLEAADLAPAPIRYLDGRNDRWYETPAETRYL